MRSLFERLIVRVHPTIVDTVPPLFYSIPISSPLGEQKFAKSYNSISAHNETFLHVTLLNTRFTVVEWMKTMDLDTCVTTWR